MATPSVRYLVEDLDLAIDFYTGRLAFTVDFHPGPGFAILSIGEFRLMLTTAGGPGGGAAPMSDGQTPKPGGWNRIQFQVDDLEAEIAGLQADGVTFRNEMATGVGAKLILLEDPSGNLVELFQLLQR